MKLCNSRIVKIENFRNVGVDNPQKLLIDTDLKKVGGLVVIIGENNVGKSNILDTISVVDEEKKYGLNEEDKPSFYGCEEKNPKISLEYVIEDTKSTQQNEQNFEGKVFALHFTKGCLDKILKDNVESEESYLQSLQTKLDKSSLFVLQDKDEKDSRDEIRLILKEFKQIYLCSCKVGKRLQCFRVLDNKDFERTKNKDKAIELRCKIQIDLDKKSIKDDANELKNYLKERHMESENKDTKTLSLYKELGNNNRISLINFKTYDVFQGDKIKQEFENIFEIWNSLEGYADYNDRNEFNEIAQRVEGVKIYESNLEIFQESYEDFKALFENFKQYLHRNYSNKKFRFPTFKNFLDIAYSLEYDDIIKTQFGFAAHPKIIFYEANDLENSDLSTTPEDIREAAFFTALFEALKIDMNNLTSAYEKSWSSKVSYYRKAEEEITKSIRQVISKRFNNLFYNDDSSEIYDFRMSCEEQKISFELYKNQEPIELEKQSEGFQFYFSFFFNFLQQHKVSKGDIVLIDEAETHLSIPAQKDFRKFLKDFGEKNGITFIITTHSPFMLDITHLDEVRILKPLDNNPKETQIINDFSVCNNNNALFEITKALGVQMELGKNKLVFVEGITDYHYLYAFKNCYEKEKDKILNLVFLPIGGLGKFEKNKEEEFQEKLEQVKKNLIRTAQSLNQKPLLLVDNDKAGTDVEKLADDNFRVVKLKESFEGESFVEEVKEIEDLFEEEDKKIFELYKKSNANARNLKNTPNLESHIHGKTKARFYRILEYLESV